MKFNNNDLVKVRKKQDSKKVVYKIDTYLIKINITTTSNFAQLIPYQIKT